MTDPWQTTQGALQATSLLIAVAAVTASTEWLIPWRRTGPTSAIAPVPGDERGLRPTSWSLAVRLLQVGRVAAAVCLVLAVLLGSDAWSVAGLATLAACCVLLRLPVLRVITGMDGAEAVMTAVALAAAAAAVAGDDASAVVALVFVALLVSLEYAGAGFWKATNLRHWASGENLTRVLNSQYYGSRRLRRVVGAGGYATKRLASAASVGAIALEVAAPLALLLPPFAATALVLVLFVFHLINAVVMGLNTFVWAYAATYPAVLFVNGLLHDTVTL